jgi:hypothetical protein
LGSGLSALQWRALGVLAEVRPRWRLTGGAALAGFYLGHRATRDLDLFWAPMEGFGGVVASVEAALVAEHLRVERV